MRLLTLVPVAPGAGLALVVVSALAEGADRLVAEEVLAAGADRLILEDGAGPRSGPASRGASTGRQSQPASPRGGADRRNRPDDLRGGASRGSRPESQKGAGRSRRPAGGGAADGRRGVRRGLQDRSLETGVPLPPGPGPASDTWQAPDGLEREQAYERAGRYVVDRCDAIIAVWDGEKSRGRGGTAEIVGYAQEQGVPIAWVHTKGGPPVSYALENKRAEVVKAAAGKLRKYNAAGIDRPEVRQARARTAQRTDARHRQGDTHRPARPVPGDDRRLGISLLHPRRHPGPALSAPVPVAQPGHLRPGRPGRGGRRRADEFLARANWLAAFEVSSSGPCWAS